MEITKIKTPDQDLTTDPIPRHGAHGAPKIYPEGTDPEPLKKWIASGGKSTPPKGGAFYTRTTTFIDALDDKSAIGDWKVRKVLEGLALDSRLYDSLNGVDDWESAEGKKSLKAVADQAHKVAGGNNRAELGDVIHQLTEDYDNGKDMGILPPDVQGDLDAWISATEGMEPVGVELFLVNDGMKYAGTADRFMRITSERWAEALGLQVGDVVVADLKTGKSVDFARGKYGLQLAAYANAKIYDPITFKRSEIEFDGQSVDLKKGVIFHLPVGSGVCYAYSVDLVEGYAALQLVRKVREYRKLWAKRDGPMQKIEF